MPSAQAKPSPIIDWKLFAVALAALLFGVWAGVRQQPAEADPYVDYEEGVLLLYGLGAPFKAKVVFDGQCLDGVNTDQNNAEFHHCGPYLFLFD